MGIKSGKKNDETWFRKNCFTYSVVYIYLLLSFSGISQSPVINNILSFGTQISPGWLMLSRINHRACLSPGLDIQIRFCIFQAGYNDTETSSGRCSLSLFKRDWQSYPNWGGQNSSRRMKKYKICSKEMFISTLNAFLLLSSSPVNDL